MSKRPAPQWVEIKRHADFVSLIVKAPRTAVELSALIGVQPNTVRKWLRIFEDEALIRRAAEKRKDGNVASVVWEWAW